MEKKQIKIKKEASDLKRLNVFNISGEKIAEINTIFDGDIRHDRALALVIKQYLANQRTGLASTKTRGEVSGGGRKPWKQKGTGRARVGSSRNPLWHHGGVVFGPHPRDHHYNLSPAIRNLALKQSLEQKNAGDELVVLDVLKLALAKTKEVRKILDNLKLKGKTLLVITEHDNNFQTASRNIPDITCKLVKDLNAYDVLKAKNVILLQGSLDILGKRMKNNYTQEVTPQKNKNNT